MNGLGYTLRSFGSDLASMILFLVVFLATRNIVLATGAGILLGVGQVVWCLVRKETIGMLQWAGLGLVLTFGIATLLTGDPRFIMFKPTAIHLILGAVMLKKGWMLRYASPDVRGPATPLLNRFGYVWAGLMFLTAALNLILVFTVDPLTWAIFNAWFSPVSLIALFAVQNVYMRSKAAERHYDLTAGTPPAP